MTGSAVSVVVVVDEVVVEGTVVGAIVVVVDVGAVVVFGEGVAVVLVVVVFGSSVSVISNETLNV